MKGKSTFDGAFGGLLDNLDMWDPLMSAPMTYGSAFESDDAVIPTFTDLDAFDVPAFNSATDFLIPLELEDEIPLVPELFAVPSAAAPAPMRPASQPQGAHFYRAAVDTPALHRTLEAKVAKPKPRRADAPRSRHHSRKAFADGRPRIKGRFARKEEVEAFLAEQTPAAEGQAFAAAAQETEQAVAAAPQAAAPAFVRAASEDCVSSGSINDHVVPQGF